MPMPWASLLWFAAIVAAIPAVLWLLKRTPVGGGAAGAPGAPRPVSVLPLSASQRLVTVEVGHGDDRRWLVLGVTAQGIATLHTMAAQTPAPPLGASASAAPAPFAQLLQRLRPGAAAQDAR